MDYWGGGQKVCWPPSQIIGGGAGPLAPSSYAYDSAINHILCPSLDLSSRDGSNEGSQRMFKFRNKEITSKLSSKRLALLVLLHYSDTI